MKKHLTTLLLAGSALAFVLATTSVAQTSAPPTAPTEHHERHPAIRAAIHALERAKTELQAADHDFGGHRVQALEECDKAIAQLQLALQYDRK